MVARWITGASRELITISGSGTGSGASTSMHTSIGEPRYTEVPAIINNGRLDVVVANTLGQALFSPVFADPTRPANHARFTFLNPRARDFWIDLTTSGTALWSKGLIMMSRGSGIEMFAMCESGVGLP